MLILACVLPAAMFTAPVLLVLCSRRVLRTGRVQRWFVILAAAFCVATAVSTFVFGLVQVDRFCDDRERAQEIGVAALLTYLALCGVAVLASRDARRSGRSLFWLMLPPLAGCVVGWGAALAYVVIDAPPNRQMLIPFFLMVLGSLVMLVGWLKWWAAVRRAGTVVNDGGARKGGSVPPDESGG